MVKLPIIVTAFCSLYSGAFFAGSFIMSLGSS